MAVLKIKDQNGNIIPVPSIAGKSAYSYAQDGGYTGTESEFAEKLAAEWATAKSVSQLEQEIVDHENNTTKHITEAERTKWNKNISDITALNQELANMKGIVVESVDEMTDTSKQYVLKSTGTIWEYKETTVSGTVREACDDGYTYPENSRLGSDGSVSTSGSYAGYTITPFIDLSAYPFPYTLHLDGAKFVSAASDSYTRVYGYNDSQAKVIGGNAILGQLDSYITFADANVTQDSNGNTEIIVHSMPTAQGGAYIRYVRLSGKTFGTPSVYVTYEGETTTAQWVDTGVPFGSGGGGGIDTETLAKILELNNEGADPATIKLLAQPVLDFYNASAYSDSDYTTSHLEKITYPCRADIPVPYTVKWNHNEEAMRTTLVLDTKAIGTVNNYRMRIYDVTGFDNYPLYNLLPNTRYYYKVTHVMADGSLVEAKNGNFLTSSETIRLLHIDGTQNVRDLGGWTGLDGKTVKYGKLIRGASLSDSSFNGLIVTGKGRLSLGELKIQAELNLGATDTETSIASNCSYQKVGYNNYALAITDATSRANFKTVLEKIVSWLSESTPRNVYFHCQGGCDRTGTLSFQLLGLLGVSESDLAKEYELSSFSDIGFGRLRTTTKAVNTYDYVGMVEAIKAYSGDTITDKFYNFALDCGISADTITSFRNLMLE